MAFRNAWLAVLACLLCVALARPAVSGQVFIVGKDLDMKHHLYAFDRDGSFLWATQGPETTFQPNLYTSVAAYGNHVYVIDKEEGVVEQFDLSGTYVGVFADVAADLLAATATHIEFDSHGHLYVHGWHSRRAGRYDLASGDLTQTYSAPDISYPYGIDADARGYVYVVNDPGDEPEERVFRFSPAGALIESFPLPEVCHPYDLAIDEGGEVLYLVDHAAGPMGANVVQAYSIEDASMGQHLRTIAVPGMVAAEGLHFEPTSGSLFVASYGGFPVEVDANGDVVTTYINFTPPFMVNCRDIAYIPEPATLALLAFGGMALLLRRRK